jgi:predicted lipoprotein with Yx(FWY)xxD motif
MVSVKRIILSLSVSAFVLVGSLGAASAAAANSTMMMGPVKTVKVAKFGQILVNTHNQALYYWDKDTHGRVTCTGACAKAWPPMLLAKGVMVPTKVAGAMGKFGVVMGAGGTHQLSFNGHPLYTYSGDKKPLQVLCDGVDGWHVMHAAGMMH